MMILLQHISLLAVLTLMMFPILFFQSKYAVTNVVTDLPIMVLINLVLMLSFLEHEIRRNQYRSILLLVIAAISVFSAFFRVIPLPMGITMAFLLPIASGVVFGPTFGFIIGQLSMLVGGVFMGAFGPWMPYQAILMGIVGYYAGFLFHRIGTKYLGIPVVLYAFFVSFIYGYWMSITYWPIAVKGMTVPVTWMGKLETYNGLYAITSMVWDASRAVGNIAVFAIFFVPTYELLLRAKNRLVLKGARHL